MAQYLSNNLFEKNLDEETCASSLYMLLVSTAIKLESVSAMFDDANITLTRLIIIWNYIGDTFGKRGILPE